MENSNQLNLYVVMVLQWGWVWRPEGLSASRPLPVEISAPPGSSQALPVSEQL